MVKRERRKLVAIHAGEYEGGPSYAEPDAWEEFAWSVPVSLLRELDEAEARYHAAQAALLAARTDANRRRNPKYAPADDEEEEAPRG